LNVANLQIRQAVVGDLETLVPLFDAYRQFCRQTSDQAGAREFLRARFEHGQSVSFLAFVAGVAVGFMQLYPSFSSASMARIFVLNDLFVSPEGRRCGAGMPCFQRLPIMGDWWGRFAFRCRLS
jgi:hypothetical protein